MHADFFLDLANRGIFNALAGFLLAADAHNLAHAKAALFSGKQNLIAFA